MQKILAGEGRETRYTLHVTGQMTGVSIGKRARFKFCFTATIDETGGLKNNATTAK